MPLVFTVTRVAINSVSSWVFFAVLCIGGLANAELRPTPVEARRVGADTAVVDNVNVAANAAFAAAVEHRAQRRYTRYVKALMELVASYPRASVAADALFAAANASENELAAPGDAQQLYRRIVREYPDARVAYAAGRRLEYLAQTLGDIEGKFVSAESRFIAIKRGLADSGEAFSIAEAQKLVADNPTWPGRMRVSMWIGRRQEAQGQPARALTTFRAVAEQAQDDEIVFDAALSAVEIAGKRGQLGLADTLLSTVRAGADPARKIAMDDARARLSRRILREQIYHASIVAMAVVVLGFVLVLRLQLASFRALGQALLRPPWELFYVLPVLAVLVMISLSGYEALRGALILVSLVGLVLTWLCGTSLRNVKTGRRWKAVVYALACAVAGASGIYIALHRNGLVDTMIDTLRYH